MRGRPAPEAALSTLVLFWQMGMRSNRLLAVATHNQADQVKSDSQLGTKASEGHHPRFAGRLLANLIPITWGFPQLSNTDATLHAGKAIPPGRRACSSPCPGEDGN